MHLLSAMPACEVFMLKLVVPLVTNSVYLKEKNASNKCKENGKKKFAS